MSELINNRENKQKILKELILELHDGKTVEDVKERFADLIEGVSATEIAEMENALIAEGMKVEQIQNLCDVHAAVFKGSIEDIHANTRGEDLPGHPVYTFRKENKALESLINNEILPELERLKKGEASSIEKLKLGLEKLWEIDRHYSRKENLLFPYMEKHDITAPPKVMWGVDDEIRAAIKTARDALSDLTAGSISSKPNAGLDVANLLESAINGVNEMIFKEENILFPMVLDTLNDDEWLEIKNSSDEIGYCLVEAEEGWQPRAGLACSGVNESYDWADTVIDSIKSSANKDGNDVEEIDQVNFDAGFMTPEEINAMLNTLPIDITFVGKEGTVKYFSQGKDRIFVRPKTIIGREVKNCHPPASVHIVEEIVSDFMTGKKDHEDFWIKKGDLFVYIRYFAVRNSKGEYLGTIEVSQDIKAIQELTGEKRLMD